MLVIDITARWSPNQQRRWRTHSSQTHSGKEQKRYEIALWQSWPMPGSPLTWNRTSPLLETGVTRGVLRASRSEATATRADRDKKRAATLAGSGSWVG